MSFSILFPTNEFTSSSKSPEEIQLLTLPSCISVEETLNYIASKGLPSQYPYLYKHLNQGHSKVLSFVCSQALSEEPENQLIIASAFKILIQEKGQELSYDEVQLIFETCLECLNNLQSGANEEMGTVIELIVKVHSDKSKLLKRLEGMALDLGRPAQPSISKVTAGRLATILGAYNGRALKNQYVDILKRVLSDSEAQARKIGLEELFPRLLQVLDLQFVELHFQQRIFEAVWDENEQIGVLALEVILKNASRFSQLEQSSRIIKLFVDSLTSKNEKISIMATSLMGQAYQKLQHVILRSESHCIKFWKSLVELSQSKNEKILNNMVYNLPGILILAAPYHKVDPLCDIFIDLFYNQKSDKYILASYFHEMVKLFPSKWIDLKELFYWMISELLEDNELCDDAIKIANKIIAQLGAIKQIFISETACIDGKFGKRQQGCLQAVFCNYIMRFLDLLIKKKVSLWIEVLLGSLKDICSCFSAEFIEVTLLPKLYSCLRNKTSGLEMIIEMTVLLLSQEGNPQLINTYISKISTQLMKSSRSFERDIALSFFYRCTFQFSIDTVQEYRLGEKYLSFNTDKNYKIRTFFIEHLPRILYFLTKEEKIEYSIIVNRLKKDQDIDIQFIMNRVDFEEDETIKQQLIERSKRQKELQKEKITALNVRKLNQSIPRRPATIREIKKDDILRKRIDSTKVRGKITVKEIQNKRKVNSIMVKAASNNNMFKHV